MKVTWSICIAITLIGLIGVEADAQTIKVLTSIKAADIADGDGDDDLNAFYVNEGFASSLFSGAVTDAELTGVDLLVIMLPDDAFAVSEITAMANHLSSGRTILFMGEQENFAPTENGFLNAALSDLGSSMELGTDSLDPGFNDTVLGQILSHPLNDGVNLINYGNVNSLSGVDPGNGLFLDMNLTALWGGVESVGGGSVALLGDVNMVSHIEDTVNNDNHVFFTNIATVSEPVPTVSEWGLMATALLLFTAGTIVFAKRRTLAV